MVRYDSMNDQKLYEWLFILYCPDNSLVRDKMIYASTRASFRRTFGQDLFVYEICGTSIKDISYEGYLAFVRSKNSPAPLTDMEQTLSDLKIQETTYHGADSSDSGLPGVSLPVEEGVKEALDEFNRGDINFVQLAIALPEEKIVLSQKKNCSLGEIIGSTPVEEPRFHFYNYKYNHEGSNQEAKLFIYYVPGFKSSIRHRMIYSTSKSPLTQFFEKTYGPIAKKLEIDDLGELNNDFIMQELHPPKPIPKPAFSKPKRPGRP